MMNKVFLNFMKSLKKREKYSTKDYNKNERNFWMLALTNYFTLLGQRE